MKKSVKILYVDDEPINRFIFKRLMEKQYDVLTAENGNEGLEILENEPLIEFVVSDMRMPEMSGIEFIKKAQAQFNKKKYFILTGYSINEEIQEALNSKLILQYWTKPADFKAIKEELDKYP